MVEHEKVEGPNWDTAITCSCGERCRSWMEFYRHRGDAYKAQVEAMKPHMPFAGVEPWEG